MTILDRVKKEVIFAYLSWLLLFNSERRNVEHKVDTGGKTCEGQVNIYKIKTELGMTNALLENSKIWLQPHLHLLEDSKKIHTTY